VQRFIETGPGEISFPVQLGYDVLLLYFASEQDRNRDFPSLQQERSKAPTLVVQQLIHGGTAD